MSGWDEDEWANDLRWGASLISFGKVIKRLPQHHAALGLIHRWGLTEPSLASVCTYDPETGLFAGGYYFDFGTGECRGWHDEGHA